MRVVARRAGQRGMGAIAAIIVLVVLASIAAAIVRLSAVAQSGATGQLQATRASLAAAAGIEWGLYQAYKGTWAACSGQSITLDLSSDGGMWVTVTCGSSVYNEGETSAGGVQQRRIYTVDAVACNSTSCPDAGRAVTANYVERRRVVHAVDVP